MSRCEQRSPGLTESVECALSELDKALGKVELRKMSVGPVSSRDEELLGLSKTLYGWVIETMQIDSLRSALAATGSKVDDKLRQIKLLEKILIATGTNETEARSMTAPLVGLNELRVGSAHIGRVEFERSFQLMKSSDNPTTHRARWLICVNAVAGTLISISRALKT